MNDEKKLALLIDSDNVSAKYAQFILQEASKHGTLIYKRIYGDWEKNNTGWRIPAMNNSIMPVQQNSYIAGKNATDFSMIIDAMDILYTGNVDGFVLVTSDSDFTRLAIRLRESGMLVIGIGEVKTPLAFTSSCHHFSYLNQVCENIGEYTEETLRKAVIDYVKENDDGRLELTKINAFLTSSYGNVDFDALGFNRLSMFIDSFPELTRNGVFVSQKKSAYKKIKTSPESQPDEKEITRVVVEYLKRKGNGQEKLPKVAEYVSKVLGKIDFSRFGSKRFARFIDNQKEFVRRDNMIALASAVSKPAAPAPKPEEKIEPKPELQKPQHALRITSQLFAMEVKKYAADCGEKGGNLGQLNNMLLEKYGKRYVEELGFSDFAAAMNSVSGVKVEKNFVALEKAKPVNVTEPANEAVIQEKSEETADKTAKNPASKRSAKSAAKQSSKKAEKRQLVETDTPESSEPLETVQNETVQTAETKPPRKKPGRPKKDETPKADINLIKRDVFEFVMQNDNAASAPALGTYLTQKYGKGYIKEAGFTTFKKLLASINGVVVKDNVVSLGNNFIKRTREIEKFIYDFARNDETKSIKSLTTQLRKKYDDFDFTNYGYSKFSDFINAIDGVRANGYYVEPVD